MGFSEAVRDVLEEENLVVNKGFCEEISSLEGTLPEAEIIKLCKGYASIRDSNFLEKMEADCSESANTKDMDEDVAEIMANVEN